MLRLAIILFALTAGPVAFGQTAPSIDTHLEETWRRHAVEPAAPCSDEQFLRRVSLDLLGRIPTTAEREEFLRSPDRPALVDRLLDTEEFNRFWSELWTTQLYGYADDSTDRQTLTDWLHAQLRANRPYDQIALDLVSASGESAFTGPVNFLLRYPEEPVVKVSRAFLGIRLDCARCHDHPFDRWTQADFQRMNRFFDAVERREVSNGNTELVDVVREVEAAQRPRFLSGAEPRTSRWRAEFGLFLTRSRPFARNFSNRIWYHLVGRGIVHPVDDVSRDNPAAAPELLEWLSDEAIRTGFDTRHMVRLVCGSRAYQLASTSAKADDSRVRLFAVRPIKPLIPEQWYESMCTATGRAPRPEERSEFVRTFLGDALDGDFSASWEYRETVQGLMSRLVDDAPQASGGMDELFVRFLGRTPTSAERESLRGRTPREVGYILLHSSEFAFNH
ncbi:DUF1549 domain-containing protein [Planctomyces sp. SH-PL14]|uniref:DUF1549 domain-containing protein n=1 Tax=Planctomyces sp. SH-PL14 TaxID=1632864 RepID=UPI00078B385D|nr:DUF1549 domain-containing protein [Planctomyces sp. SH-PL14]AMV16929.1 hypothetical protein VT03_03500 [Planctomyces sp. SH-PL14]